ncbi:MAG: AmmeMemoRadiSam system radical SAM enzyme [Planctomycetota bacterium]
MNATGSLRSLLSDNTVPAHSDLVTRESDAIRCLACGHRCLIRDGREGICRVRFNRNGELRVPGGYVAGLQVDPIEKKPFNHAFPGRDALSFGMLGCDLHCSYCQNWVTSQALRDDEAVSLPNSCSPKQLVELAIEHNVPVVVSTYNEPLITSEWAVEVFKEAKARGLTCGYVSNGNGTPEVLRFIRPYVDLYKVDLKSFDDRHYRELGGVLANVLATIEQLVVMKFWVEIVTLVIPGFNDSDDELIKMAAFLAGVSKDMPWHVTAFHPDYKMTDPPCTPVETLVRAHDIGKAAGLRYVYAGNLPGDVGENENTFCPTCNKIIIRRRGFYVLENRMTTPGRCPGCDETIAGVWESAAPRQSAGTGIPKSGWR